VGKRGLSRSANGRCLFAGRDVSRVPLGHAMHGFGLRPRALGRARLCALGRARLCALGRAKLLSHGRQRREPRCTPGRELRVPGPLRGWGAHRAQTLDASLHCCTSTLVLVLYFFADAPFQQQQGVVWPARQKVTSSRSPLNPCVCSYSCYFPCHALNHEAPLDPSLP